MTGIIVIFIIIIAIIVLYESITWNIACLG